jgi:murein hydrolase activator
MRARLLILLLCLAGMLLPGSLLGQAMKEAELAQLQATIEKVKAEIASTRLRRGETANQLQLQEVEILRVRTALQETSAGITALETELAELQARSGELEASRQEQQALIADYLLAARAAGKGSSLKLLLNQDDPTLGSRMLRYYQYLGSARSERLLVFRTSLAELNEVSTNIRHRSDEISSRQQRLEEEETSLALQVARRQTLLEELDKQLGNRGEELAKLEQQRREVEVLLEELHNSINLLGSGDADTPFAERRGQLPWPVEGTVRNAFGSRHALGDLTWEGMTLETAAGTPVRAIYAGRIVFADWLGNSGLLLIIDHGDGFMSLYAHNQELYKLEGDWVAAGEQVATVGNSGGQRVPALYFEIRRNGKAENPVQWCVARR